MRERDVILHLTLNEAYALESIFLMLEGSTKRICKDYQVDARNLWDKVITAINNQPPPP